MLNLAKKPRVAYLGLTLEYYRELNPARITAYREIMLTMQQELAERFEITASELCCNRSETADLIKKAEQNGAEVLVVSALSYTDSYSSSELLAAAKLPVVFWNTQYLKEVTAEFCDADLSNNHTVQGIHDVAAVLHRLGGKYDCVSGHWNDPAALERLEYAVKAARAAKAAQELKVLTIAGMFKGMDDFLYDAEKVRSNWGPQAIESSIDALMQKRDQLTDSEIAGVMEQDKKVYDTTAVSANVMSESTAYAIALEKLVKASGASAFTLNFKGVREDNRLPVMPFYGINKLLAQGYGYAGEGDFLRAALMAELAMLGSTNFTEIYPVDFVNNRLFMSHMQECNPAWSKNKIFMEEKDFGGDNPMPYCGMRFECAPGAVTLVNLTENPDGNFRLIASSGNIPDLPFFIKDYHKPYWFFEPANGTVEEFLDAYSLAGGTHHLIAVKAPLYAVKKLAQWHNFDFVNI